MSLILFGVTTLVSSYMIYDYFVNIKKPSLYYHSNEKNFSLLSTCNSLSQDYWPTWWCHNQHLSTILGYAIKRHLNLDYEREEIDLVDGAKLYLDFFKNQNEPKDTTILLIVPGLNGSSHSSYIQILISAAHRHGFQCYVKNPRGTQDVKFDRVKFNTSHTDDLRSVINHLRKIYPTSKLFVCGFSYGANMLCKYLGEEGNNTTVTAGISVSNPFSFLKTVEMITEKKVYNYLFTKDTKKTVYQAMSLYEDLEGVTLEDIDGCQSLRDIDDKFTKLAYGYETVDEYYEKASCANDIQNIKTPILLINARDDPLVSETALPIEDCLKNENTILCILQKGGHLGFLEGHWPRGESWLDRVIIEYLNSMIQID